MIAPSTSTTLPGDCCECGIDQPNPGHCVDCGEPLCGRCVSQLPWVRTDAGHFGPVCTDCSLLYGLHSLGRCCALLVFFAAVGGALTIGILVIHLLQLLGALE